MKNIFSYIIDKTPFRTQTTLLVWIMMIGFLLIASVSLLALNGLKAEFDNNSLHSSGIQTLITIYHKHKMNDEILKMWESYKTSRLSAEEQKYKIEQLRQWYAKNFMPQSDKHFQELLSKEQNIIESIDKAIRLQNEEQVITLIEEQILISFHLSYYGKEITDTLYNHTYIVLLIFMFVVGVTILALVLSIKSSINTNHLLLEQTVESKTKELQTLNANLQKSIEYEVEQNRKKDLIMYQQARLASMGEMIQNIAHQWRQPLNSLVILIQSFKSKAEQNKLENQFVFEQTKYGMKIATEMSNTIENFRNFFRPETQKATFNLKESIEYSLELLKEQLLESRIKVAVNADSITLKGYQNSFTQVILVIINNAIDAIKHTRKIDSHFAQARIEITLKAITLDKLGYNILVQIRDNAGGINLNDKSKVFEPYFTTKHQSVGTGVGLYMAQQIVQRQFKGSIEVSNTNWGDKKQYFGAEFRIFIPQTKDKL